jgi:hypothetical protein
MLVLPLASLVEKQSVSLPLGKLRIKGEMWHEWTTLPSSEDTGIVVVGVTTRLKPEVGVWLEGPLDMASSRVDLPCYQ